MSAKEKGARSERKVRDWYESRGWYVVKAGGSLGIFDLVCLHPDHNVALVQVKTNRGLRSEELHRIQNFQAYSSWTKVVAIVKDYHGITFSEVTP